MLMTNIMENSCGINKMVNLTELIIIMTIIWYPEKIGICYKMRNMRFFYICLSKKNCMVNVFQEFEYLMKLKNINILVFWINEIIITALVSSEMTLN